MITNYGTGYKKINQFWFLVLLYIKLNYMPFYYQEYKNS